MVGADRLRDFIGTTENSLKEAQGQLQQIEASCPHNRDASAWGPVQSAVQHYREEVADVFAPMLGSGVDRWHASRYVDAQRMIWTRTCKHCGKVEQTAETKPKVTQEPAF